MTSTVYRTIRALLLLATCLPALANADNNELLQQADTLLKSGNAEAAYALLAPLEDELADNAHYDYLLGIAALDSKQPGKAVFALERAITLQPGNPEYRAELARAYYELGEKNSARDEFNRALTSNMPASARASIQRYLSSMNDLENTGRTRFHAFIDYSMGYDSNINSATTNTSVAVPLFGGAIFNLGKGASKQSDQFTTISGGADFSRPINPTMSIFGGIKASQRNNWDETAFDLGNIDINAGVAKQLERNTISLSYNDNTLSVDSGRYRHAYGLTAQWLRNLDNASQVSVYGQAGRVGFPSDSERDSNRYVTGVGYAHLFPAALKPVLYSGAYIGKEDARRSGFDNVGFDLFGLRLGGQLSINPRLDTYASLSYENRHHDERDAFFNVLRQDKQHDISVGARYTLFPTLVLQPAISYTRNESNYVLSDYERFTASITLRKDFNW